MQNQVRDEPRQGHMKSRICLALSVLGILNVAPLLSAGAQNAAPPAQLPNLNTSSARPELQKLLEQVEAQLAEATARDDQEDIDRLIDLRGQLQVIQLQVELEDLQRQNDTMLEQDEASGADGGTPASPEMAGMEDEVRALNDMQSETVKQLNSIAEQHAFLLEQLGQDMPGIGAEEQSQTPPSNNTQVSARLREVQALNARFQTLADQQKQISEVLAVVSAEHADLLVALGVPEAAHPRSTYTVQAGDSLSSIAQTAYGSADRWTEIVRANPSLTEPSLLYVGTVLKIP